MRIIVVGLGYVGLPLAVTLAKHFECWGVDIDAGRIAELETGHDRTNEIGREAMQASTLKLTSDASRCPPADMYIVTVPTPIDANNKPDLGPVRGASKMLGAMIAGSDRQPVIVYESTVYPGVTEDICGPILAQTSGLKRGEGFWLGYSPERINPGDREHTVDRIIKVIAGETPEITEKLAEVYGRVTTGGVFRAASIKAAEAAKVIENTQRDLNIAFMNELARIFDRMDISIWDVLDAAETKWNFLPFRPGLVGGHCIGVDPYYLSYRAEELGFRPEVILAGRQINDTMADWLAERIAGEIGKPSGEILVLGLTFKENVPDLRNSKNADLVTQLNKRGFSVTIHDPYADPEEARSEFGFDLALALPTKKFDCVIGAVAHKVYQDLTGSRLAGLLRPGGLVADPKKIWDASTIQRANMRYWTL